MIENGFLYPPNLFVLYIIPIILIISFRWPHYFVCLSIALMFLRPNERFDIPFSYATMIIPLMFLRLLFSYSKIRNFNFEKDDKIFILLMCYILAHRIIFASSSDISFTKIVMTCCFGLINYFSIIIIVSEKKRSLFSMTIFLTCLIICFEPIYYHFNSLPNSDVWYAFHGRTGRLRAWGLWQNSNETAFIANICISSMLIYLLTVQKKMMKHLFFVPVIIMLLLVIFLTASRAGMFSLFLIFSIIILTNKSNILKFCVVFFMVIIIAIAPHYITKRSDQAGSTNERFDLRYTGIQIFKQNPIFGVGYMMAKEHGTGGMALHCTYIQAFAELGVLGGGLLVYYIYLIGKRLFTLYRNNSEAIQQRGYYGLIIGILLSGLFYFYYGNQLFTLLFINFMGLIRISTTLPLSTSEYNTQE